MVLPQDSYLRFGPYLDLMTGVRTALSINEGIIKVVAPEGCGKTALCRTLASDLKAEGRDVIFFETPPESVEFLHKRIQTELDLPRDKNFTRSLTNYLLAKSPPDNKLTLIYDDAERISKDIFILIRLLNNVHDRSDTLVSQVICGTDKLDRVFDDPDLRSLTQYLNQSFTLAPMTRDELDDFYSGFRKHAGISGRDMSNKELTDLYIRGKGLPGKTFELLEQHYAKTAAGTTPATAPAPRNLAGNAASHYAREVEEILDEDAIGTGRAALLFKAALSLIVVSATIFLAVVLSGDNREGDPRLIEILADDSPLYLDEVDPDSAAAATPVAVSVPVVNGGPGTTPAPPGETAPDAAGQPEAATAVTGTEPESPADEGIAVAPFTETTDASAAETPALAESTTDPTQALTPAADDVAPAVAGDPGDPPAASALVAATETPLESTEAAASTASTPEPAASLPAEPSFEDVIQAWLDAWQAGNYAGYLAAYHPDFESPYHDSREAWESERESRIAGVSGIEVSHDRFEVVAAGEMEATVRFWLYYSRGSYADETLKELRLRRDAGTWQILDERNLELIVR